MANQAPAAPTIDPKAVAANIVKGVNEKSNGKAPAAPAPIKDQAPPVDASADVNSGKEKYVVDGKEVWITPEQRTALIQKGIAFEPKVDQLARLQQETNAFLKTLSSDPLKILTDKRIGLSPEAVLEKIFKSGTISDQLKESVGKWYWENVVEPTKLSPEQLKARENEKWRQERETKDKEASENAIKQENAKRVQMAMSQISANIAEAMKESGLPDNNTALGTMMARRVADIMRLGYFQRQTVTPKQAIEKVRSEMKQVQTAYYDNLNEEDLVKELGEKNAEKVKKYFLKLVKDAEKKPPVVSDSNPKRGERKTINQDDFHEYLDKLKRGEKWI